MKLLFVIKFLSVAGGGAERVLTQVASALGSRGHQVSVLTYDAPDTADFYPLSVGVRRLRLGLGKATSQPSLRPSSAWVNCEEWPPALHLMLSSVLCTVPIFPLDLRFWAPAFL